MTLWIKAGRYLLSFSILWAMLYMGKGLAYLIPIGISESIWGMLTLLGCLILGWIKVNWILPTARLFTRYMTIFFLPLCVGMVDQTDIIQRYFAPLVLANLASTVLGLILIGLFAQWIFFYFVQPSNKGEKKL